MTWASKLMEKGMYYAAVNESELKEKGKIDVVPIKCFLFDGLVLAVLEEYRFIVEKSKQIKNPTSRKKFLRQRLARMSRELVQACKEVNE